MARISKYKESEVLPSTAKWRAGLYYRLSKEDGDKDDEYKPESDSISNQRLIVEDFLVEYPDISVVSEYADDGYTGINFERPEFQKLLEDIRLGKINCVIVKDLSRFGRNYLESGQYLDVFFPIMNVRFISVVDNIDSYLYPSSINNISVSFKNVINEEYCRDISNKIRSTFVAKRENGEYLCGFAVYGYVRDSVHKGQILIDQEAAEVVRYIFQLFLEGTSVRGITFKLNSLSIPNPCTYKRSKYPNYRLYTRSSLWNMQSVKSILKNRMYTGDLVQGRHEKISHKVKKIRQIPEDRWVIVENHHEGIIDKESFQNVQDILKRDTRISPKSKELALFAGFLKCADCGRQMVKKKASRRKFWDVYHYYTCVTYDLQTKAACTRHTMRSDVLEKTVFTVLSKYIEIAVDMDSLIERINSSPKRKAANSRMQSLLDTKEKEKIKTEKILLDLYPDYKNEMISKEQYLILKERYESEIAKIEQSIKEIKETIEQEKEGVDGSNAFIQSFKKYRNIEKLTREVLIALVEIIYVHEGGGIEIVFKFQDAFSRACNYIEANKNLLSKNDSERIKNMETVKMEVAI